MKGIEIKYSKQTDCINIKLPIKLLIFAIQHKDWTIDITDKEAFTKQVLFELKNGQPQNSKETGITAFQEFLDTIMEKAIEDCPDCCNP